MRSSHTFQQAIRLCTRFGRNFRAAKHPRDLFLPPGLIEQRDAGLGNRAG
jgi:hypothetical protein